MNFNIARVKNFDIARAVHFEHNLGENSQKNRYLVGGIILLTAVFYGYTSLLMIGLYLVGSAFLNWCPVLSGMGKNTTDNKNKMYFDVTKMAKFERNLGKKDQKNRYIIGGVLFLLALATDYFIFIPISALVVASAYFTWCPVCSGLGINTYDADKG